MSSCGLLADHLIHWRKCEVDTTGAAKRYVLLSGCTKACSHSESSWKETHSTFFVTCHNTARSLSIGSLRIVASQETRRRIVLPSLAANKSGQIGNLLWRGQSSHQTAFSRKWIPGCKDVIRHLMTRCITC